MFRRARAKRTTVLAIGAGLLCLVGCYKSHGIEAIDAPIVRDASARPDVSGNPSERDASQGRDATVPRLDAGAPFLDAGMVVVVGDPPPDPTICRVEPVVEPFSAPVLEKRWPENSEPIVQGSAVHVCSTPIVIDLEPEGDTIEPQVVFISYPPLGWDEPPGVLRIWNPKNETTVSFPAEEGVRGVLEATGTLAAGDIDGDGKNEIVGVGTFAGTYAFRSNGTLLWESPYPSALERGIVQHSIGAAATLADLEGDGTVEVIVGRNVLRGSDGSLIWSAPTSTARAQNSFIGPINCVADLDGDGGQEVIIGSTAMHPDGTIYWNNAELPDGLCAVADAEPSRPGPEVVLVGEGVLVVLDGRSGEEVWRRGLEGQVGNGIGGAPTIADFDGDGRVEFGVAHGAAYGVYDMKCIGAGDPAVCAGPGLLWQRETSDDSSSGTGSSVFDFNGDGRAEVTYNDQYFMRIYDGLTGATVFEQASSSRTRSENPVIADVDNDGDAEIVFSTNAEATFIQRFWTDPGVEIWGDERGRWVGSRRIWNQHSYHITNVEEDGTIGGREANSWTVLNAYRQNLREEGDVLATPDLWARPPAEGDSWASCDTENAKLSITVRIENWGLERAGPDIEIILFAGNPAAGGIELARTPTQGTIEPLGAETVFFRVDISAASGTELYVAVDDSRTLEGGAVAECREDNNVTFLGQVFCN